MTDNVNLLDRAIGRIQMLIAGVDSVHDSSAYGIMRSNGLRDALAVVQSVKLEHDLNSLEEAGYFGAPQ